MQDTGEGNILAGTSHGAHSKTLQLICLGSGGGPCEDNVTGFLIRSASSGWVRNSLLAVDAGSHLAPITRILERDFPTIYDGRATSDRRISNDVAPDAKVLQEADMSKPKPIILDSGPFAGLKLPEASARANALHILRSYISAYLITHPHLDHLSGFAINTAAFHATSRPKTVAALPSTVDAMKRHIFNDVIWPNLTDEDGGVGFVTFQRLKEGGDAMVGEGEGRGYIEVCDGLGVRAFKVSHGVCTKSGPSHQHRGSIAGLSDSQPPYNGSVQGSAQEPAYSSTNRSLSMSHQYSAPGTPSATRTSFHAAHPSPHPQLPENVCVVDSTALFIRDCETAQELLFFGDVEPDSLSLHPRNHVVWAEAARKIVLGHLGAIVIECSYDDSQADAFLFGHLNPRHLVAELQTLAAMVEDAHIHKQMEEKGVRKRKQSALNGILLPEHDRKRSRSLISRPVPPYEQHRSSRGSDQGIYDAPANPSGISTPGAEASVQYQQQSYHHGLGVPAFTDPLNVSPDDSRAGPLSPKSVQLGSTPASAAFSNPLPHRGEANLDTAMPLKGIRVIIIHVKDTLRDGPHVSERILEQLQDYEINLQRQGQGLGCDFVISKSGESYWV